ncbi:hypothetical protein AGMMS49938_11280 [Fibrobacterales bacterium]|nr:hypothetical protein AGMMS49938_11280 [Fibrobacterales bacterium]
MFLCQTASALEKIKIFKNINAKIPLTGVLLVIIVNTLFFYDNFKNDNEIEKNPLLIEDQLIRNFLKEENPSRKLLFTGNPTLVLSYGTSSYSYYSMFAFDSNDVQSMIKEFGGEVYFINGFFCGQNNSMPKMQMGSVGPICDRFDVYFKTDKILDTIFLNRNFELSKIIGLTDRDSKNLLRIFYRNDNIKDSIMSVDYMKLKKDSVAWKVNVFINDSLITEVPYQYGITRDFYPFRLFSKDTNRIDMFIIDSLTSDTIHKDYWKLLRNY